MEYADKGDLQTTINESIETKEYLSEGFIWRLLSECAKGLNALHKMKILHRDLKSANIFLFRDGRIKLGDMNVSKEVTKNGMLFT